MKNFFGGILISSLIFAGVLEWQGRQAQAATKPLQGSLEPPQDCPLWCTAGDWELYLCPEDWDAGVTCVHSQSGFMSCRWTFR